MSNLFEDLDLSQSELTPLRELRDASRCWKDRKEANLWFNGDGAASLEGLQDMIFSAQDAGSKLLRGERLSAHTPAISKDPRYALPVKVGEFIYLPGSDGYREKIEDPKAEGVLSIGPMLASGKAKLCKSAAFAFDTAYPPSFVLPGVLVLFVILFWITYFGWSFLCAACLLGFSTWASIGVYLHLQRSKSVASFRKYLEAVPLPGNCENLSCRAGEEASVQSDSSCWRTIMGGAAFGIVVVLPFSSFLTGICVLTLVFGSVWLIYREWHQLREYESFRPYVELNELKGEEGRFEEWLKLLDAPEERVQFLVFGVLSAVAKRLQLRNGVEDLRIPVIKRALLP